MTMDTYIVRIYRRKEKNPDAGMAGIVEKVGINEQKGFKNPDELIGILGGKTGGKGKGKKENRNER